ncbi:MAG: HD domain-containing protein [Planctomycetota bacterium]|nr:MAG: HD domain-containing protein [Planctomycetota bacterium]
MEQEQLDKFRAWFDDYVAGFYGDDEFINANIKLKDEHSRRTCQEMLELADELGLSASQRRRAEVLALLHDIGRFEQFVKYRTYNDPRSVNHCLLGLEVLRRTKVLEQLQDEERELVERVIEYHGLMELPAGLDGECLLLSKLLRDADKLDIFYVVTDYYQQYRDDPEGFKLEIELPDEPGYSMDVVEQLLAGQRIDYSKLRTWNDMKLCQLGWIYDVNFSTTLKRIKQRGFLEMIFEFLPATEDIKRVREKIFEFVESAIARGG